MADVEGGQPTWAPGPNVPFSSQHFRTHSTTRHHSTRCCERCAVHQHDKRSNHSQRYWQRGRQHHHRNSHRIGVAGRLA
jgi:hypothetical protein